MLSIFYFISFVNYCQFLESAEYQADGLWLFLVCGGSATAEACIMARNEPSKRHWLCPENSLFSDVISMYFVEIKKAWEFFFRAYPSSQAFALPLRKDKQRKPAHAKETICPTPILHTHEKMGVQLVQGYNPLTQTLSVALPLCEEIKVAKFDYTDSNVRKRLSEPRHT